MTHPMIEAMEDAYYAARETDRPMISAGAAKVLKAGNAAKAKAMGL